MAMARCQAPYAAQHKTLCSALPGNIRTPSRAYRLRPLTSLQGSSISASASTVHSKAGPANTGGPSRKFCPLQQSRRSSMPSVKAHAWLNEPAVQYVLERAAGEVLLPVFAALLVVRVINIVADRTAKACDKADNNALEYEVMRLAPVALRGPTKWTVLILVGTRVLRNVVAIFDSYIHLFHTKLDTAVDPFVHAVCGILGPLDRALLKLYGAVMLACGTWVLIQWKTIAILYVARHQRDHASHGIDRALLPLNSITNWVLAVLCGLYILHWYGLDLQPLLAVGGASSIIIGLATQQTLSNAVNGIFLFITRPFVTGEYVTLQGGGVMVNGIVESIGIMRTIVRNEDDTLVSVPNKTVSDMTIQNRTALLSKTSAADRIHLQQPIKLRVKLPHSQMDKLNLLSASMEQQLLKMAHHPRSVVVSVNRFTEGGVELLVKALVEDIDSEENQKGIMALYELARSHGATLISA